VLGRAVGAIPPTGSTYRRGQRITVLASIPEDVACLPDYQDRSSAWRFLDFATGHAAAPLFARRVRVFVDDGEPTVLTRRQANDPSAWEPTGVLDALRDAVGRVRLTDDQPVTYAVPSLQVVPLRDRRGACARPLPSAVARLPGLSFVIEAPDSAACVDHVDLLRTADDPAAPLAAVVLGAAG
jgi:hypothetical protein